LIEVHSERCNGCGVCLEVCPNGALYLIQGKAVVDEVLCQECEACVAACPTDAIEVTERLDVYVPTRVPTVRTGPEVIAIKTQPAPVDLRAKLLPVVGAALSWTGRELVPRLAIALLEGLDRRAAGQPTTGLARGGSSSGGSGGSGRQQRHRHRGGRASSG